MSTNPPVAPETAPASPSAPAAPAPVAPVWHTVLFLTVVLLFAALAARTQGQMIERHGRIHVYLVTLAWEYLLVGYILWGAHKKKVTLKQIVGGRWNSPQDLLLDVGIAFGYWIVAQLVLAGVSFALGLASASQMQEARKQLGVLLPRSGLELGLWVALSVTAGFCEEFMFRGYLQQQFRAATRSTAAAILLQAVVFGLAHAYQGGRRIVLIAVYGVMFGMLAAWRRSLRPGMIGHAFQDSVIGLAFRLLK